MAMVINTNIAALNAQRNLGRTQGMLDRSLQRLSSGLRINSAKDDAAGLAIANRMGAQIRGLNQAVRNANDGVSLAQTAEGALQENTNILQRIREVAVQSANSTNTASDRASLNLEVQQLISEFDRIASQTEFNGQKLLTGTFSGTFQVGANVGQSISVNVSDMRATAVGATSTYTTVFNETVTQLGTRVGTQYDNAFTGGTSTINGVGVAGVAAGSNSLAKINAINEVSGSSGVSAFSIGNGLNSQDVMAAGVATLTGDVVINGVEIGTSDGTTADMIVKINNETTETGVTAVAVAGDLVLANSTGDAITINVKTANADLITGFDQGESTVAAGANGAIVLSIELGSAFTVDADATALAMGYTNQVAINTDADDQSVVTMSVTSVANANSTILTVDEALEQISTERGSLGAVQNRFESTIANLSNVSENLSAARSRIMDADFAAETAEMTKAQVLQQAGVAMLAQANMLPQAVLGLLQ